MDLIKELIAAIEAQTEAIHHILHTREVRQGLGAEDSTKVALLLAHAKDHVARVKAAL